MSVLKTSNKYSDKKIVWFADKLDSFRTGKIEAPIYVRIKPTNRCCHKCFFCVYHADYSGMHETMEMQDQLSREKLLELLDDLRDIGTKAVTYSGGGEPLMHPDILEILEKTKENGLDLSVLTNGQLLKGEISESLRSAKWVRVSMDYSSPEEFQESRGRGKDMYDEIINNIREFAATKDYNCDLSINFIITKFNYQRIYDACLLLKSLKIDNVRFSPVWIKNEFIQYHKVLEKTVLEQLSRARKDLQTDLFRIYDSYKIVPEVIERKYEKCFVMQTIPAIGADGNVYCCHNKSYSDDAIIGNISAKRFKHMWFSEEARRKFMEFNPKISCQCQCANDSKNIFIHELLDCHGDNYV